MSAVLWFVASIALLLGLAIGSFLNVVIWRVPRALSLNTPSACPKCGSAITPLQNIPVVSWVVQRGKCRGCGEPISAKYPLIEALTAVAFVVVTLWWVSQHPSFLVSEHAGGSLAFWLMLCAYLWFASVSIALTAIDLECMRLPSEIVLPSLLVLLCLFGVSFGVIGDWESVIRLFAAAAVLFVVYLAIALVYPKGMGGGDVKLAPSIGVVLAVSGWGAVAIGAFSAFVLAAVFGGVLMVAKKIRSGQGIPFGPWMLGGAWLGIFWGEFIANAYLSLMQKITNGL